MKLPLPITGECRIIRKIQKKIISFRQYDTENEKLLEKHLTLMVSLSPGKKENALSMFTTQHLKEVRNLHKT